jgi:segregation and condensation protein A
MSYTVALDAYHGPLDLLLYLVKRNEVDVLDIPIARIADQFREYLTVLRELDVEFAGDFLVMTATLMEIKSRMLLPVEDRPEEEDVADPRRELVRQLLEYRKIKDAAAALEERAARQGTRVPRQGLPEPAAAGPAVRPVELWDLVSAFARLMRETQALETATIAVDDTPQHVYEGQIKDRVRAEDRVSFRSVFTPPYHKARLIGIFLAILELVRHHGVGLEQPEPDGEIWLVAVADPGGSERAGRGEGPDGRDQPH